MANWGDNSNTFVFELNPGFKKWVQDRATVEMCLICKFHHICVEIIIIIFFILIFENVV